MTLCSVCRRPLPGRPVVTTHVRCRIPGELVDELLLVYEKFHPRLTCTRMALDFGVQLHVMTSWLRWALERRRDRARAWLMERGFV